MPLLPRGAQSCVPLACGLLARAPMRPMGGRAQSLGATKFSTHGGDIHEVHQTAVARLPGGSPPRRIRITPRGGSGPSANLAPADHGAGDSGAGRGVVDGPDGESRDAGTAGAGGRNRPHKPRARVTASPSAIDSRATFPDDGAWTSFSIRLVHPVAAGGSQAVPRQATKTYTLVAANAAGSKTSTAPSP